MAAGRRGARRGAAPGLPDRSAGWNSRAFAAAPQHAYLVRTIEPVGDALPLRAARDDAAGARARSTRTEERSLMREHGIEILVTKNSGGDRHLRQDRRGARASACRW